MKYCFGVDIGGTTVKIGLFGQSGEVFEKWEIVTRTENNGENILPDISASILGKIQERKLDKSAFLGVGVGVPGPVAEDGSVNGTPNIGWKYKNVKKELEDLTGLEAWIENDANVAALGEMWKGGGLGEKNIIMITLGTGVGSGVISGGKIISGSHGAGGEIGHICVNYEETAVCGCGGRGCLEQYASATGIVRLANRKLESGKRDTLLTKEPVTAKAVFDAVKLGDRVATEVAEEFGCYLGYTLANIALVVDPAVFVIGGGVSRAGEVLIPFIQKPYLERAVFGTKNVKFSLATLGNDAGICGCARLVLSEQDFV
ncbi:MAG: ROK family glucokinase [Muricomes sp.]